MGASHHSRTRFFRAKALAQEAVEESPLDTTVFAPSIVYTPGDPWLTLLDRLSRLPAVPISGSGRAVYEPIWAEDVADAVMSALSNGASGATTWPARSCCPTTTSSGPRCGRAGGAGACCTCRCRLSERPCAALACSRARRSSPPGRRRS